MGSPSQSFQCFDAILDETSLKPSLSSGHQSAASHVGFPSLNRLPEDVGCYLCADLQQAVASGTYSPWFHYQTPPHAHQHVTRRPMRAEEAAGEDEDHHHHHHRHSRRIVLVKNSDPAVRRTIVLHRRSLRSLGLFMEEVSELMLCPIRKIYTLDGHKVDSVQSLLQCSGVLVCVGREPFHPLLLDSVRKNSHDKLPKLNLKSRSGVDEKTDKKNVNLGLETRRDDSSNKSTRLMMSPGHGLSSLPPAHPGTRPHTREGLMDDDIEKRVLVNKDGSLSMEMKVRFRLLHDETLQWSTEIKKSTGTLNESHVKDEDACCISHSSAESCSEGESLSASEAEETYNVKRYQRGFEDPHCQHCCAQCQEYNIWENPILPDQTAVRHIRSSSSSASSCRIVRKKTSTDSMQTMSSEEYTEHVVENATCIKQTFGQQGDTTVKHCTINCCCRRSEVCLVSSKTKSTGSAEETCEMAEKVQESDHDKKRPDNSNNSQKEQLGVQITEPTVDEERPVSTVSSSSQILASLQEDQDEEDLELPSISRTSYDQQEEENSHCAESNPCSDTPCRSPASMTLLSPRPPSKSSLGRSKTCHTFTPTEMDQGDQTVRPGSAESALSKTLSGCSKTKSLDSKNPAAPMALENKNDQPGTEEEAPNETSATSPACSQDAVGSAEEHNNVTEERPSSATSIKSYTSGRSNKFIVTEELEQEHSAVQDGRAPSAISTNSQRSENSKSEMSEILPEDQETEVRTSSAMSIKSDISVRSTRSKLSDQLVKLQGAEERTVSGKSNTSVKSNLSEDPQSEETEGAEELKEETASDAKSATSNRSRIEELANDGLTVLEGLERVSSRASIKSPVSQKSKSDISEAASFQEEDEEDQTASGTSVEAVERACSATSATTDVEQPEPRASSTISAKSNLSATSKGSNISEVAGIETKLQDQYDDQLSAVSHTTETVNISNDCGTADEEIEERTPSALSTKSITSVKSERSKTSDLATGDTVAKEHRAVSAKPVESEISESVVEEAVETDEHNEGRAQSALSAKSNISAKSKKSNASATAVKADDTKKQDRAPSVTSGRSHISTKSSISAKSNSSVRTRTSKVSEIKTDEPNQQKVERASSSRSLKSDVSEKSNKSHVIEAGPEDLVKEDKEERTASVLSSITNVSARSTKSNDSVTAVPEVTGSSVEERAPSVASVTSKRSNISNAAPDKSNGDVKDSVMSNDVLVKSNASTKSKCSLFSETEEPDERPTSVVSPASAASTVSKADVERISNRSPSQLSAKSNVSARSKRSKVSEVEDHKNTPTDNTEMEMTRDESPMAGHLKVSQTVNSNKCVCGAVNKSLSPMSPEIDSDHEEIPASPRSCKSPGSTSERVLTPTSTSVSLGIVDDCEADDVEKTDEGAVSVNSKTSQTEIFAKSDKALLESPVQAANERATQTPEERSESFTSATSKFSDKYKSKCSHCSSELPTDTVLDTNPSANCSVKQSSPTQELRSSSKASNVSEQYCGGISAENTAVTSQGAAAGPDVLHKSQSICSKCSSPQNKGKLSTGQVTPVSPVSGASAHSDGKSRNKHKNTVEMIDRPDSTLSNSSSHLQLHDQEITVEATVSDKNGRSGKNKKSCNKSPDKNQEDVNRCQSASLSVTSGNRLSPSPPKSPKKSNKLAIPLRSSKDNALSQTVPVPEIRENTDNLNTAKEEHKSNSPKNTYKEQVCALKDCITNVSDNKSEKSSKCRRRIGSSSSCQKMNDDISEMSPSCLPNTSPTEVVNEWLRKIPSDTNLCELEDDFHEIVDTTEPLCTSHEPPGEETQRESFEEHDGTKLDKEEDGDLESEREGTVKKSEENHVACEEDHQCIHPQAVDEPKMLDSSVLVMKVLLSPKFDRCHSLPEVSPAYSRKLSTSAQGLLDCLAKLQLLDFSPTDENSKKAKYQELMSILKSLWLCDPKDREKMFQKRKSNDQQPQDEEFKARSSSGVDVNSGSTSSGKSSVLDGTQAQINTECEGTDALTKVQEVEETVEALETPEPKCDSVTEDGTKNTVEEKLEDDAPGSDETIQNSESPRQHLEKPPPSNTNVTKNKEFETDHQEDTSSGSPPAPQRPPLSKRVSQDPDPMWVLNLLNKLEKQFMKHYVNAMLEFKVRWNLEDNKQLDSMICELQHEVHRRIQSSVDRELKKIQGRAGRPRPPKALSRESTAQTEQRRRRLKVMCNQSIDPQPQKSEDDCTMTGTDFSDQRSDDEYCPCDLCVKKKMTSKPVLPVEMLNSAPVMMDFDLRRILQVKKSAPINEKIDETVSECKGNTTKNPEENVDRAEEHENETVEDEDKTADESETAEHEIAEQCETAEDKTSEDGQNAQGSAEKSETVEVETAEKSKTAEGIIAEDDETANDDTAEDGQHAEVETEGEGETGEDEAVDDGQSEAADEETTVEKANAQHDTVDEKTNRVKNEDDLAEEAADETKDEDEAEGDSKTDTDNIETAEVN